MNHDQQTAFENIAGEVVLVPVVEPDVYCEPEAAPSFTEAELKLGRRILELEQEIKGEQARLLSHLIQSSDGTAEDIGRTVLALAYDMKVPGAPQTLEELGQWIGVRKTRASNVVRAVVAKSGARVVHSTPKM